MERFGAASGASPRWQTTYVRVRVPQFSLLCSFEVPELLKSALVLVLVLVVLVLLLLVVVVVFVFVVVATHLFSHFCGPPKNCHAGGVFAFFDILGATTP